MKVKLRDNVTLEDYMDCTYGFTEGTLGDELEFDKIKAAPTIKADIDPDYLDGYIIYVDNDIKLFYDTDDFNFLFEIIEY